MDVQGGEAGKRVFQGSVVGAEAPLEWALSGPDAAAFSLDKATGELFAKRSFAAADRTNYAVRFLPLCLVLPHLSPTG